MKYSNIWPNQTIISDQLELTILLCQPINSLLPNEDDLAMVQRPSTITILYDHWFCAIMIVIKLIYHYLWESDWKHEYPRQIFTQSLEMLQLMNWLSPRISILVHNTTLIINREFLKWKTSFSLKPSLSQLS